MVTTMGFYPGGAEILPIRLANEFKRQGCSVLLLSAGFNRREEGVRRMLRNDIPLVETSDIDHVKAIIHDFGVEVLNTHQWHIQKYPMQVPDVFDQLQAHVASLHGMIEHGNAFDVTEEELRKADQSITTWVYTAEKNLVPFSKFGLYDKSSSRFVKILNGMQPPSIVPIPRADMGIPENAFVLCCVSRAIPDKGWAETILVVERARALSGRDIRLILVGNGTVYDDYCRIGVPDFVYLAGFSANSVGHYASADMGIMLTTFKSESFPLTIVDCLFAGKPYIASDVGDIRNMLTISKDVAGEVIELVDWEVPIEGAAEVVASFATDKEKYVNALALVQGVANRYHIDIVASQYIHLFAGDRHKIGLTLAGT
jgi:glycosyltransferase involved in cell wall biosynthesis